jgi:hypothetical protein
MERMIVGEIFIAILLIGVVYAAVSPMLQPISFPQLQIPWFGARTGGATDHYALHKGANVSETVNYVDLNVTVKFGAVLVRFSDDPNLAVDAVFHRDTNASELEASYSSSEDDTMQVNLYGESGELNLTLGQRYEHGGDFGLRFGAVIMELGENSNASTFDVAIRYAGGMILNITEGASFGHIDFSVDLGGLVLNADTQQLGRSGSVDSAINIGGVIMTANVDTDHIGVSLEATVDTGGVTVTHGDFDGEVTNTACLVKTAGYSSADKKLDVTVNVGAGGVSLQGPTSLWFPGIRT